MAQREVKNSDLQSKIILEERNDEIANQTLNFGGSKASQVAACKVRQLSTFHIASAAACIM